MNSRQTTAGRQPPNSGSTSARPQHRNGVPHASAGLTLNHVPGAEHTARPRSPAEKLQPKQPPKPPRNNKPAHKRRRLHPFFRLINGILTLSLLLMALTGIAALVLKTSFEQVGPLAKNSTIVVPRGRGLNAIASHLEQSGVVTDSRLFVANVYYKNAQSRLKAGRYQIPAGASISDVVNKLVEGRAISYKVTFPEGRTSTQMVARLRAASHLIGEIQRTPPEGTLLPDTYSYEDDMPRIDIINRMRSQQQIVLDRLWQTRQADLPIRSKQEALILASIVEKETGIASERNRVAAVFINRLRKGMRLQSDPTVIYGLVGGQGSLGHPIRRSELKRKTAYNTYQIDRLPPTPICNPGSEAIKAVLNPAQTEDLYFVANGTGGHIFATSLKAHNYNVRNWRKIERAMRAKQKADALKPKKVKASAGASPVPDAPGVATAAPSTGQLSASNAANAAVEPATKAQPTLTILNNAAQPAGNSGSAIPLPVRKPKKYRR